MPLVCYYILGAFFAVVGIVVLAIRFIFDKGEAGTVVFGVVMLLLGGSLLYFAFFSAAECPNCEVAVNTYYCPTCGWDARPALGICTNCGSGGGDTFCIECGAYKGGGE